MEKKALVPIVLLVVLAGVAAIVSQSSQLVVPTLPPISPSGEDCEVGSCPDGSTYQKYHWNGTSCDLVQYFRDPCTPNPTPNPNPSTFHDDQLGLSLQLPNNWFGIKAQYGNANGLLNYDPANPSGVAEKDRARILEGSAETALNENDVRQRFESIVSAWPQSIVERLTLDGRKAIRVTYRKAPELPGAPCIPEGPCHSVSNVDVVVIQLAVADGLTIFHVVGQARVDANPIVLNEIKQIQDSVKFEPPKLKTGIRGNITIGPTCPVERNPGDPNCADKPYVATVVVKQYTKTVEFTRFTSNGDGSFQLELPVGDYLLEPIPGNIPYPYAGTKTVTVKPYELTEVLIEYDTGIR